MHSRDLQPPDSVAQSSTRDGPGAEGFQGIAVLIVDPDRGVRRQIQRQLEPNAALVDTATSLEEADALHSRCRYDVMVVERELPDGSGIDWARRLNGRDAAPAIIILSREAKVDIAVTCLRAGAADFLVKPVVGNDLTAAVTRCAGWRRSTQRRRVEALTGASSDADEVDELIGRSLPMVRLCEQIRMAAPTPVTVLVEGESGTGKELAARSIHRLSGRKGRFVPVNCGSISPELLESELFGHAKGAFTGAYHQRDGLFCAADRGTLFLDEVGEMPLPMQAKLLRTLDEKEVRPVGSDRQTKVDVRVIAATNLTLGRQVRKGEFREDLYFRLNVLSLVMPPLRERSGDIAELANFYVARLARQLDVPPIVFSHEELEAMERYHWPGNVREMINLVERCLLLARNPLDYFAEQQVSAGGPTESAGHYPLQWSLREVGKAHTLRVLDSVDGNKSRAARRLGVSRKTLERNLRVWSQEQDSPGFARRSGSRA